MDFCVLLGSSHLIFMGGGGCRRLHNFFFLAFCRSKLFFKNNHIIHIFLEITSQNQTFFRQDIGSKLFFCQLFWPPHKYQMAVPLDQDESGVVMCHKHQDKMCYVDPYVLCRKAPLSCKISALVRWMDKKLSVSLNPP